MIKKLKLHLLTSCQYLGQLDESENFYEKEMCFFFFYDTSGQETAPVIESLQNKRTAAK